MLHIQLCDVSHKQVQRETLKYFAVTLLFSGAVGIPGCTMAMLSNGSDGASVLGYLAAG